MRDITQVTRHVTRFAFLPRYGPWTRWTWMRVYSVRQVRIYVHSSGAKWSPWMDMSTGDSCYNQKPEYVTGLADQAGDVILALACITVTWLTLFQ